MQRASPEEYQPPLTLWGHAWRMTLTVALSAIFWSWVVEHQWTTHRFTFWLDIVLGLVCYVLVFYRRRWPFPIAVVINSLAPFTGIGSGPGILAAVSLSTRRRTRETIPLAVVILGASIGFYYFQHLHHETSLWLTLMWVVIFVVIQLGWGLYLGSRRELYWQLNKRALAAEAERDERAARAREQERARIAREMHDVLAHRITQISMLSGAMTIRTDLDADSLRDSAAQIQRNAGEALADLRNVLGVLRDAESGARLNHPQPTYQDLPRLIESWRESGAQIEFSHTLKDDPETMSAPATRAVYRIVQEGITNASRHAPGSRLWISISGGAQSGVTLKLTNPKGFGEPSRVGAGLGLIGLAERAEQSAGRLRHYNKDGQFVLEGWIPWDA